MKFESKTATFLDTLREWHGAAYRGNYRGNEVKYWKFTAVTRYWGAVPTVYRANGTENDGIAAVTVMNIFW